MKPDAVDESLTTTRRLGSATGKVRSNRLLTSEKIAVFAPMPSASDSAATIETTGVARRERTAKRMSCMRDPVMANG